MKSFNNKILLSFVILFLVIALSVFLAVQNNNAQQATAQKCVVTGCSGELCISQSDEDAGKGVSICIWTDKFACYKKSKCETQPSGECGWTPNTEFNQCLNDADNSQLQFLAP